MNKFTDLAARSVALRKQLDERADKLAARLDALHPLADKAFTLHETMADDEEAGIKELEDSMNGMIGHNGSPLPS